MFTILSAKARIELAKSKAPNSNDPKRFPQLEGRGDSAYSLTLVKMEMTFYRTHTMCQALTTELIFISFKFHDNPEE